MKILKILLFIAFIAGIGTIIFAFINPLTKTKLVKKDKEYKIIEKWDLPKSLKEVSGITWLDDSNIACIEDEDGMVFIYNLDKKKIEKEIEFGKEGDYEGVTVVGEDLYVLRSDGTIFEIENFGQIDYNVFKYDTPLTSKNNVESMTFDKQKNEILLVAKDRNMGDENLKTIYAFSLKTKAIESKALLDMDLKNPIFKDFEQKKIYRTFRPSEIAVNPKTQEIYLL
ncbi:MAG: hypothetical protein V7767_15110, partial [Leeuwenhoekiella sp.]